MAVLKCAGSKKPPLDRQFITRVAIVSAAVAVAMLLLTLSGSSHIRNTVLSVVSGRVAASAQSTIHTRPLVAPAARESLGKLLQEEGMRIGAELGVQLGLFAKDTLTSWPSCRTYYLVDLWGHQENYKDITNVDDNAQEQAFQATKDNVKDFMQKIVILRNYTVLAAHAVADGELDFVYIDARHDYCGVMEDLQAWWPKLRSGGILSGHDYLRADSPVVLATGQDYSLCMNGTVHLGAVKGAVDEFTAAHGLKVVITQEAWPSWMARKP